jgi:hypothetical protein
MGSNADNKGLYPFDLGERENEFAANDWIVGWNMFRIRRTRGCVFSGEHVMFADMADKLTLTDEERSRFRQDGE